MNVEEVPVLSIGSVIGGVSSRPREWREAIVAITDRVIDLREGKESPLRLNVVYNVPGEFLELDYAGVRTAKYSKGDRVLMVQAAVPPVEYSTESAMLLRTLLMQAIEAAEEFGQKRKLFSGQLTMVREIAHQATQPMKDDA